jgi:predicted nucleotide-binding protein
LEEAQEVSRKIQDGASGMEVSRLNLADLMNRSPQSSAFGDLLFSSRAYGLTNGGARALLFELTELGREITSEDAATREQAKRKAVLNVEPFKVFLTAYNGKKIPAPGPFKEFLVRNAEVPADRAEDCIEHILADAQAVGFVRNLKGSDFIELNGPIPSVTGDRDTGVVEHTIENGENIEDVDSPPEERQRNDGQVAESSVTTPPQDLTSNNRVFITHGRNREVVAQLKELLAFGKFEPVVSVENETVAKPVPDKVLDDMRSCAAAIIHVGTDQKLLDERGDEHRMINPNVLIEIGAAMALYGRNFILLVERDVTLPSNLQGLYEARYEGDKLDYEATVKLLKAFNDFRSS